MDQSQHGSSRSKGTLVSPSVTSVKLLALSMSILKFGSCQTLFKLHVVPIEDESENDGYMATNMHIKMVKKLWKFQCILYLESMLKNGEHQVITILMDLGRSCRTTINFKKSGIANWKWGITSGDVIPWTSDPWINSYNSNSSHNVQTWDKLST